MNVNVRIITEKKSIYLKYFFLFSQPFSFHLFTLFSKRIENMEGRNKGARKNSFLISYGKKTQTQKSYSFLFRHMEKPFFFSFVSIN